MAHFRHNLLTSLRSLVTGHRSLLTSIRFRLTMWYVLILALVLGVFSVLVYTSQAQSIRAQMNDTLRADGQRLASTYNPLDGQVHLPDQPKPYSAKEGLRGEDLLIVLDGKNNPVQQVGQISMGDRIRLLKTAQVEVADTKASQAPDARANEETDNVSGILKKLVAAK